MFDDDPGCKACRANTLDSDSRVVWRNRFWVLRHSKAPYPALGWMTLHSQRHAPAFTLLSFEELADLGPVLARVSQAIIEATGAARVYIATMTEVTPHFHAHLIPRYVGGPKGWDVFKLKEQAKLSPPDFSDAAVARVSAVVARQLEQHSTLLS